LQEIFVELAVSGLASMYPAFDWTAANDEQTADYC
jgi:hypothetical protein